MEPSLTLSSFLCKYKPKRTAPTSWAITNVMIKYRAVFMAPVPPDLGVVGEYGSFSSICLQRPMPSAHTAWIPLYSYFAQGSDEKLSVCCPQLPGEQASLPLWDTLFGVISSAAAKTKSLFELSRMLHFQVVSYYYVKSYLCIPLPMYSYTDTHFFPLSQITIFVLLDFKERNNPWLKSIFNMVTSSQESKIMFCSAAGLEIEEEMI